MTKSFSKFFLFLVLVMLLQGCLNKSNEKQPNILFVFIDDMGYGDLGCYGNKEVSTPHIDQLAAEGIRFSQFYVNSPICSPSRTAVLTGNYPSKWGITSFVHSRAANAKRGMKDFLALDAPSVARNFQNAGYYTAHIGKWHMGGGRDIGEAPLIKEYGFDESITQFEGLGERYLATFETLPNLKDSTRFLEKMSADLGKGPIHWAKRELFTEIFVDHTISAIKKAQELNQPFYINLWPDDIHTPLEPPEELRGDLSTKARFLGVVQEMDQQMGRLFEFIRNQPSLRENTLIIFTSDNGPDKNVNKAGHLRGYKTNLYEGGIREPFIAWWSGRIAAEKIGSIDTEGIMAGFDLPVTFMAAAGISYDSSLYDGKDMLNTILGKQTNNTERPLFWIRPPDRPGYDGENDPDLAIRNNNYKLLMDVDGSNKQLYNLINDESESKNLAIDSSSAGIVDKLSKELLTWYQNYPHSIDMQLYENDLVSKQK
ncbi:MAG: sulfatase-like hydrolase/transferase [Bacteroidota bacterium]